MIKITPGNDHCPSLAVRRLICLLEINSTRVEMTNGVLCITDFTEGSKEALKWSVRLSEKLKCHLTVMFTYRIFKQNDEYPNLKKQKEEEASRNFASFEKEVLTGKGVSYDFKTEIGFINNRVEDHVKKNKISFLVIDKGMTIRNKEPFDDLVNKLQIPLVIVP